MGISDKDKNELPGDSLFQTGRLIVSDLALKVSVKRSQLSCLQ
jgi:hypothetical protein